MNRRALFVLMVCAAPLAAAAQTGVNLPPPEPYVPRLGDIMNTAQIRHMKLWFAGKSANWELAAYEARQLKASLAEAASFYQGSKEILKSLRRSDHRVQWLSPIARARLHHHACARCFAV